LTSRDGDAARQGHSGGTYAPRRLDRGYACDGTEEHGVHDVAEFDHRTPITVVATYEDGVHVLRPVGLPGVEVTRERDGDQVVWTYVGFEARLERVDPPVCGDR